MVSDYLHLFLFALLGAGLKTIDDIYDMGVLNRRVAYILAPPLIGIWVYLSHYNVGFATILGAIILSSLIAGKLDNGVFKFSAAIILLIGLAWGWGVSAFPLLFLMVLGVLDEFLDGYGESHRELRGGVLLKHRLGMKGGVILLYILSVVEVVHVLALLFFDLAYDIVSATTLKKSRALTGVLEKYGWTSRIL